MHVFQPTRMFSTANGRELLEQVDACLKQGVNRIVVNFQDVLFMDSMGLRYLVTAFKQVRAAKGEFFVCSLRGQAAMLFESSNLERMIPVYDHADAFLQTIAS